MFPRLSLISSLLAGTVLGNPLGHLEARQSDQVCFSFTGPCTNTAQKSSATAFCQSLGYGVSAVTVTAQATGTSTVRKTLISTSTSFTGTTTKTAATSTSTIPATKTTTLTTISTLNVTSTTKTLTINAAGTIQTCGTYTATYNSASASSPSTSTAQPTLPDVGSTTTPPPPVTSPPWVYPTISCATAVPTYASHISRSFNYCVGQYNQGYSSSDVSLASADPTACVDLCTASCVGANYFHYNNGGWGCALQYSDLWYSHTGLTNPTWTAYVLVSPTASGSGSTVTSTTATSTSTPAAVSTPTSTPAPTSTPTSTTVSTSSTSTSTIVQNAGCTNTAAPSLISNNFHACPSDNLTTFALKGCSAERTSFKVACMMDMYVGTSYQQNYNPGPYIHVNTLQDCAASCLLNNGSNCGGVTLLEGAPDGTRCYYRGIPAYWFQNVFTMDTTYPPYWGLPDNGGQGLYWTSAERLNYGPDPEAPSPTEQNPNPTDDSSVPGWSIEPSYLPQCSGSGCDTYSYQLCPAEDGTDWSFPNDMGGRSTFHVGCGLDLLEQGQRTNYWVWAESLPECIGSCMFDWGDHCGGVTLISSGDYSGYLEVYMCFYRAADRSPNFNSTTIPGVPPYDTANPASWVSAKLTSQSALSRREGGRLSVARSIPQLLSKKRNGETFYEAEEMALEKRAAPKPSCLAIPQPQYTATACSCVVGSGIATQTTTQALAANTVTSTRTVVTTLKAMSTTTTTPVKTITKTLSTITSLRTRTTTSTFKVAATTTTTGTWTLATTPSSFYIVDANNGVAMWPADADEIFYNVQYDDSPDSTDPPPTNFGLSGTQLTINDFVDSDVVVVGQPLNGTNGAQVMAFDRKNAAKPTFLSCKIGVLADGTCPLSCQDPKSGGNVSWTDSTGLWYLLPPGTSGTTQMRSFVLQSRDS